MRRHGRPIVVGLAVIALAGAVGVLSARRADGLPDGMRVGVVDLASVFKDYEKSKELEKRINEERDQLRKGLDAQRDLITEIRKKMDLRDFDSPEYAELEEEKKIELARLELMKERLQRTIKERWEEYNLELLEDIENVVRAYGKQHGFTLILKVEDKPVDDMRFEKLIQAGLKSVLYFTAEIDITADIVLLLNRRFRVGDGAIGPKPPAGG